jgi:hypothetical protein
MKRLPRWALWLLLAFVCVAPAFKDPSALGWTYDWRWFQTHIEAARRTILWYHQFPLWDPWTCGGQVALANPQSFFTAPTFLLPLLFGTALGLKLFLVAMLFCAFDGMDRLARSYAISSVGSAFCAILFGAGGWLALHLGEGHVGFSGAALFPYLLLFQRRATVDREWEWVIPLGAVAALVVAQAGTSSPAMAVVLLTTTAIIEAVARRSLRPFAVLILGGIVAFAIGALRLIPALEFATQHPRPMFETDSNPIWVTLINMYKWGGVQAVAGKRYWFHEYGWKLAYVTPPFVLWSFFVKRARHFWIVGAVGAALVAGSAIPYGPWWMLKHLPMFNDLRVPSRYAILLAIAAPLAIAVALDDIVERLRAAGREAWVRRLPIALCVLAFVDGAAFHWYQLRKVFVVQLDTPSSDAPFYQVESHWSRMMNDVWANQGAIGCDEEAPLQRADRLDLGRVPQARLAEPDAGTLSNIRWTPNRIEADVALSRPTRVLFNTDWNEHWRASHGTVVAHGNKHPRDRRGGRLAIEAPQGTYTIAAYYRPKSFVVGAAITAIAAPLCLALFVFMRRRRASAAPRPAS